MKNKLLTTLTAAFLAALTPMSAIAEKKCGTDIVDVASKAGKFNTLVTAAKAAGLVSTLKSDGPLTVFAPTDEAFAALPKGTVESLLKPENKKKLAAILKYHVISGKVMAEQAIKLNGKSAKTVEGREINISVKSGKVMINGATVIMADVKASNGVVHVIDKVLLPTVKKDIVDTAASTGKFKTLLAAAKAAGLVDTLKSDGPLTVFAPTDEAFAALPVGTVESLLKPENKGKLAAILKYHVVSGKVLAEQAVKLDGKSVGTVEGRKINVAVKSGKVNINNATVIMADVKASNGVVHVINKVLLPPSS